MQYQEKELFQGYEIRNWNFTPRLYKLLGAAAIFNILTLFTLGQADVFTTRGCDSPLVGNFCQVLDTIYLGSKLLDTKGDFVSEDYKKTELEDAEITFVDVSSATPPLSYPEGYFALANPESVITPMPNPTNGFPSANPIPGFPGIPTNPTVTSSTDLLAKPQVTPTPNAKVLEGNLNDSPFTIENTPISKNPIPPPPNGKNRPIPIRRPPFVKPPRGINAPPQPPPTETTAKTKPDANQPPPKSDAVVDFRPNKKPLEDFADDILAKREDKVNKLDLTKNFKVRMIGELNKDGKLDPDPKKTHYIILKPDEQGDQAMVDIAKAAIEAINDGGLFYYLKQIGVDKVEFTLAQDDEQIYAIITSGQKTEERAKTMSSGMTGLIGIAKTQVQEDELKTLLDSAKAEQQAKNFVLNFKIDKLVAQTMITKKLQEAEAKKKAEEQTGKPNSTAATLNTNQKTSK